MKLKVDFKSIKIKIWGYVMVFSIAILGLIWLLQIAFLSSFYRNMKQANITNGANAIAELYAKVQGDELWTQVKDIVNKSDFSVKVMDGQGNEIKSINPFGHDYNTPVWDAPPQFDHPPRDREQIYPFIATQILEQPGGELLKSFFAGGREMLLYGKVITSPKGEKAVLITSSNLQPVGDTTSILSQLLIYVSIATFIMAIVVSLIIALHVSRPITKITEKARVLATGDYDMTFERGTYSEVDQLADTLNYATKGLKQAEKMRNELIANVSHDLRTPLTMIRVYAELIRDISRNDPEACVQNASVIIDETDRLTSLVKDLLELSKLQTGMVPVNPSVFNLTHMVRTAISKFNVLMQKDGYTITFKQTDPFYVKADEQQIEQVLYNLLSNAMNYTGEDKKVSVAIADRGDKVRVLVSDTGEGIDEKDINLIWERYYRAEKEHKRAVVGTGLGLSIVKTILLGHNAAFGVDSIKGQGSTFWFELEQVMGDRPEKNHTK